MSFLHQLPSPANMELCHQQALPMKQNIAVVAHADEGRQLRRIVSTLLLIAASMLMRLALMDDTTTVTCFGESTE
jgi:hypothetical protein